MASKPEQWAYRAGLWAGKKAYQWWNRPRTRRKSMRGGTSYRYAPAIGRYATGRGGMGGELKYKDTTVLDATVNTTATFYDTMHSIAQGTNESQRIGRRICIKGIGMRYTVGTPATSVQTEAYDIVRIIVYLDKQCNGAAPSATDILESDVYDSFYNLANSKRFWILSDVYYNVKSPAGSGRGTTDTLSYATNNRAGKWWKKVNIPVEFNGSSGTVAQTTQNCIGVLTISKVGVGFFDSIVRIRYSDSSYF